MPLQSTNNPTIHSNSSTRLQLPISSPKETGNHHSSSSSSIRTISSRGELTSKGDHSTMLELPGRIVDSISNFRQRKAKSRGEEDEGTELETRANYGEMEVDIEAGGEGGGGDPARVLSIWKFIGIGFFLTCGGCFGIEEAVRAGGPLWCLSGFFLLPIFFALPQAYITAELSSMMDENGGYVIWIQRAFGNSAAYLNAYNAMASALFDMAIFPVLFASYLKQLLDPTSVATSSAAASASGSESAEGIFVEFTWGFFAVKIAFVLFFMVLNIRGVEVVGIASYILSAAIIAPFLLELFISIPDLKPKVWVETPETAIDWPLLLATLLWNFTGFDRFGTFAGEVKDPKKTYSRGAIAVVFLTAINYIIPVAVGVSIIPNNEDWGDGTFATVGYSIHHWLGAFIGVAALLSTMGNYNGSLMSASRALWAMGRHRSFDVPKNSDEDAIGGGKTFNINTGEGLEGEGDEEDENEEGKGTSGFKLKEPEEEFTMIWPIFGTTYEKYGTPIVSIVFYSITTTILMFFQFSVLVEVSTFCQCVGLIFEFAAFLWLRYKEPDTPRPYEVPGGMIGAWAISISALFFLFATILSMFFTPDRDSVFIQMGIFLGINFLIVLSYIIRRTLRYYQQREILKYRGSVTMVRHTKLQTSSSSSSSSGIEE